MMIQHWLLMLTDAEYYLNNKSKGKSALTPLLIIIAASLFITLIIIVTQEITYN